MKARLALPRTQMLLAAIFVIFAVSIFAFVASKNNFAPRMTQRQKQDASTIKLFGPEGKDVRRAYQTVDMMHRSLSDRLDQLTIQCNKKNVSDEERRRLLEGTDVAGKAAINKVVASKYTAPFEPHYPPLPE